jgi:cysteine synthase A
VEAEARRLTEARGAFRVDQFFNPSNVAAHELNTGEEMWRQTGGKIDVFVDFAGTAGTFMGCARVLKKHNPAVRCYLVEPRDAAFLGTGRVENAGHRIQGGGYAMELPLLDRSLVEDFLAVSDEEAVAATRRLAREEGIMAGFSSGANVAAALSLLAAKEKGRNIALLINDTGLKYMSNDLFN